MDEPLRYRSMKEFYPFYLSQHSNPTNRKLHFIGTTLSIINLLLFLYYLNFIYLAYAPVCGYSFAWIGHFFFEKNKPATFTYPFYSLLGDFIMFFSIITGRIEEDLKKYNIKNN